MSCVVVSRCGFQRWGQCSAGACTGLAFSPWFFSEEDSCMDITVDFHYSVAMNVNAIKNDFLKWYYLGESPFITLFWFWDMVSVNGPGPLASALQCWDQHVCAPLALRLLICFYMSLRALFLNACPSQRFYFKPETNKPERWSHSWQCRCSIPLLNWCCADQQVERKGTVVCSEAM